MRCVRCTFFLIAFAGCGVAHPIGAERPVSVDEARIVAARGEGYGSGQLFEDGTRLLREGRCRQAVEQHYDRLVRDFPTSRYVVPALYNAGLCLHEGGQLDAALPYYRRVIERAGSTHDAKHAALQLAHVYVELERWEDGLAITERLLLREDLRAGERLEGLARRAECLLGLARFEEAERQARDALSYYRARRSDDGMESGYFAAAANFVLAETLRQRSERIELPPASARGQLDERAVLLLAAQREYVSTIHFTQARWDEAAGARIGAMYDVLWRALSSAPERGELARYVRPLLDHAMRAWEATLAAIEARWAEHARAELARLRALLLGS